MNKKRRMWLYAVVAGICVLAGPQSAWAQGGAGATGTISGVVTDETGGALPGVTVTATNLSAGTSVVAVSDDSGVYRFLGAPTGRYELQFDLPGFTSVARPVNIAIGATGTVNVTLAVGGLQEALTVSGEAPLVDTTTTRVTTGFNEETVQALPSTGDFYSLLALAPAVEARANSGTNYIALQSGYSAYGSNQQSQPMVEGINMQDTSPTSIVMFPDMSANEDVLISAVGNTAEVGGMGVLTNMIVKSGGNRLSGDFTFDFQQEGLQSHNIAPEQIQPTPTGPRALPDRAANRLKSYRGATASLGGPIVRDRLFYFGSYSFQKIVSRQIETGSPTGGSFASYSDGSFHEAQLPTLTGKVTFNASASGRDRLVVFYQRADKLVPYRTGTGIYTRESSRRDDVDFVLGKGEYNRTFGQAGFFEARYGYGGYLIVDTPNTDTLRYQDLVTGVISGADNVRGFNPARHQVTSAFSWFVDNMLGGTHNLKLGGDVQREENNNFVRETFPEGVLHRLRNGAASQVELHSPTSSWTGMTRLAFFVSDAYKLQRMTLNLGVRLDRFRSWLPEQTLPASRFNPVAVTFPADDDVATFTSVVPRVGATVDLFGDGRTAYKVNYGQFAWNPGNQLSGLATPNTMTLFSRYNWTDANGDLVYQSGEEGTLVLRQGGVANADIDPNLTNSYSREFSTFLEHQFAGQMAVRGGFVWKGIYNGYQRQNVLRPLEAFNVPVQVPNPAAPGEFILAYNLDNTSRGSRNVVVNGPADVKASYRTIEATGEKRFAAGSVAATFAYTWTHDWGVNAVDAPTTPNDTIENRFGKAQIKLHGNADLFWGLRVAPQLRFQSGAPYGREVLVALNYNSAQTMRVEPVDARRTDNLFVTDVRVTKSFPTRSGTAGLYLDVFNMFNANSNLAVNITHGPTFEYPLGVLSPRVLRIGASFRF